jgi:hypothetical protein
MRPRTSIVPRKGTDRWLYETLRHLQQGVDQSALGLQAIVRGEVPDGSGTPLPNPDLTPYFKLIGRSPGQVGYGSVDASGSLSLGSTSHATKGFIYLGVSHALFALDETQGLYGFNKGVPASTLHLVGSAFGSVQSLTLTGDIDTTGTQWVPRGGGAWAGIGGTCAAAMSSDDGNTSMAAINFSASGNNPQRCNLSGTIVPGAVYTVTLKYLVLGAPYTTGSIGVELVDSTGTRWVSWTGAAGGSEGAGITAVNSPPTFPAPTPTTGTTTVTRTVTCAGSSNNNGTGGVPNSINLYMRLQTGASDLYGGVTYVTITQAGSSLMRWDFQTGTQSGGIDIFGRLGINTGSTTPAGEIHIQGTSATVPLLYLKQIVSQTGDTVQVRDSTGAVTAAVTSRGAWAGHTDIVMDDDEVIGYEDDTVFYY